MGAAAIGEARFVVDQRAAGQAGESGGAAVAQRVEHMAGAAMVDQCRAVRQRAMGQLGGLHGQNIGDPVLLHQEARHLGDLVRAGTRHMDRAAGPADDLAAGQSRHVQQGPQIALTVDGDMTVV